MAKKIAAWSVWVISGLFFAYDRGARGLGWLAAPADFFEYIATPWREYAWPFVQTRMLPMLNLESVFFVAASITLLWIYFGHLITWKPSFKFAEHRQHKLVLALSRDNQPKKRHAIRHLSPELAEEYAGKTPKTVSRDLNAVCQLKLVEETPEGYVATRGTILAFLPIRHDHEQDKIIKEWSQESEASLI